MQCVPLDASFFIGIAMLCVCLLILGWVCGYWRGLNSRKRSYRVDHDGTVHVNEGDR